MTQTKKLRAQQQEEFNKMIDRLELINKHLGVEQDD